ncbi:MAG TPA: protein kinase [Steroidobacteraceae bacterium]|jgi:tRNA A-37 threonylcarbamoyl transferase component Bud32/CheY-like chemotaxis protein|nr:protein kinase [Steroidobacteraceae bacterium]
MRLLMFEDDARYCALIRHHLTCRWPDAELVVSSPVLQGKPAPEFLAQGFDAVLLAHEWPGGHGLDWLQDFVARPRFAPVIFLSGATDDESARQALQLGAHAAIGRAKIEHGKLLDALASASSKQVQARAEWRTSPEAREAQKFGEAFIRGYRRVRRLAAGPVSELYLAESEQAGALVVLKVARDQQTDNELDQSFRRFLQEYEIVQRIHHPGVVRLHDLGVSDQHAYLVMEYFRQGDLRRRMRSPMSVREALKIATGIARALDGIHSAGVLHRDLKPGNVMLRDDGSLALIDFGLAKDAALAMQVTDHGQIFGTPHYMSPEQGHGERIDVRSDLYSLGVMLFEMLTRQKPYVAENPMAIIYKHRNEAIPMLPEPLRVLQPLIEKLLAKKPDDRVESAAAAVELIREAARGLNSTDLAA